MTLQEIGLKHQTDKASHHHYLPLYELLFQPYFGIPQIRILEIGVQFGNSLRTWHEYFLEPLILGIDSVDNNIEVDFGMLIRFGDAYTIEMLQWLSEKKFHIIIDDGSHAPVDQCWFVNHYTRLLKPEGILIVEDVLSEDTIPDLVEVLPEGFQHTAVEMCEGKSQVDSRLFIAWPID